ncbi:hypothetical protein ACIQWZ_31440 [Streptomyces sp. NPDC098077]|uniref:hypothetical protein n=1 Tax=Streptomyces sp. NPDC098077 TaxID=3366093 RepID=UPI0038105AC2
MSRDIAQAWERIERWLAENAPGSHRSLRAPAAGPDIDRAGAYVPIHGDLRFLLTVHDGTEGYEVEGDDEGEVNPAAWLPGGCEWLSVERMLGVPAVALRGVPRPDWAPWAAPGDAETGFGVDGATGQVRRFPDEGAAPVGSVSPEVRSVTAYLGAVAEALESGTGALVTPDHQPGIALGCLLWEDPERVSLDEAEWSPLHGQEQR